MNGYKIAINTGRVPHIESEYISIRPTCIILKKEDATIHLGRIGTNLTTLHELLPIEQVTERRLGNFTLYGTPHFVVNAAPILQNAARTRKHLFMLTSRQSNIAIIGFGPQSNNAGPSRAVVKELTVNTGGIIPIEALSKKSNIMMFVVIGRLIIVLNDNMRRAGVAVQV